MENNENRGRNLTPLGQLQDTAHKIERLKMQRWKTKAWIDSMAESKHRVSSDSTILEQDRFDGIKSQELELRGTQREIKRMFSEFFEGKTVMMVGEMTQRCKPIMPVNDPNQQWYIIFWYKQLDDQKPGT